MIAGDLKEASCAGFGGSTRMMGIGTGGGHDRYICESEAL
jgi:hypothetical protein